MKNKILEYYIDPFSGVECPTFPSDKIIEMDNHLRKIYKNKEEYEKASLDYRKRLIFAYHEASNQSKLQWIEWHNQYLLNRKNGSFLNTTNSLIHEKKDTRENPLNQSGLCEIQYKRKGGCKVNISVFLQSKRPWQ